MSRQISKWVENYFSDLSGKVSWKSLKWVGFLKLESLPCLVRNKCSMWSETRRPGEDVYKIIRLAMFWDMMDFYMKLLKAEGELNQQERWEECKFYMIWQIMMATLHTSRQLRTERDGDTEKGCQRPAVQQKIPELFQLNWIVCLRTAVMCRRSTSVPTHNGDPIRYHNHIRDLITCHCVTSTVNVLLHH